MRRRQAIGAGVAGALAVGLVAGCSGSGGGGGGASPSATPRATGSTGPVRSVLTGEPGPAGRVVAVKIDNVAAARPQTGLNSADLVYGIEVEGGLSRLMAVLDSNHLPPVIGPVRSARETDLQLLADYNHPVLAFSGAQSELLPVLKKSSQLAARTGTRDFFRNPGRPAPHNEYLRPKGVAGDGGTAQDIGLRFAAKTPAGGTPVTTTSASMPSARFTFSWNGSQYRVAMDGRRTAWTADNVIVQHVIVKESRFHSRTGFVPFSETVGSGTAVVLRDGRSYSVRWSRPAETSGTTFRLGGATLPLRPGRTWIILEPR
ncbi:Protein of unknown function [Streptomyces sp. DvalAA-14]|uniref:DUF3048 domain-containing protein n=1 Tax=unclassified Streptomyces TaxID=2593676 RepID=UPI00081B77F2|nr:MULTISPECIES: DUF3048 domain-containing protein [unclassified Streptomyces]MYS24135.1 DUF3048 domain-containing protein [Streptomyces sp. SID4948]SCE42899.1 Protein of unknown function [Streptomyces sp. DvalAA-14]